ncbi:hypothetical protein C0993_011039 [Termitomyces sp. T159_Od127]|nr:hypothetical protein C0993_011039 [Termitomyces sp. T159_Od127]
MQQPTLTNIRIRSVQDAHKIFYAVQKGRLERIKRRLDADERNALCSGCIYVWEQRGSHAVDVTGLGIERFTEGKKWTASRVRDEFLFYYQIKPHDAPNDWDQLIKQTYSVWVNKKDGRKKWHLTAYFSERTINDLGTIDDIPAVSSLYPPSGLYSSPRIGRSRPQGRERLDSTRPRRGTADRTYAPFPNPSSPEPVTMHDPYNTSDNQSSSRSSPYPMQAVNSFSLNASSSQHGPSRSPSSRASLSSYYSHHDQDPRMSRDSSMPSPGGGYSDHTWSGGTHTGMAYPSPSVAKDASQLHYAPRNINLPSVNTIFDEQQLYTSSETGLPSAHVMFQNPHSLEIGLPMESYELNSQDGSQGSKENHNSGLALAPIFERRRYAQPRNSLDDIALRSFL